MFGSIGPAELLLILVIGLLAFGAGRVASLGKGLGDAVRSFRRALRE